MPELPGDKYIARSPAIASRVLDGETMVMSTRDSTLFSLNEVASVIWESADGQTLLSEIVENKICAEFDVEPQTAYQDALTLVEGLAAHGILLVSDKPIVKPSEERLP